MRQYLIFGLMIFGLISCTSYNLKNSRNKIENNVTVKDKKVIIINLDKEIEKNDYSKGGLIADENKIIPIFIGKDIGPNDEVAFKGEVLKKAKKIKIGANDEVAFSGDKYTIKTSELKDGDKIIIKDKDNKIFITMKVRSY